MSQAACAQDSNFSQAAGQGGPYLEPPGQCPFPLTTGEPSIIDHVSIGVRNIAASKRFYDAALLPLGYQCLSDSPESLGYGAKAPALWVNAADRPVPADSRSGLHLCFSAPSRRSVEAFHSGGLATGGHDNGRPGLRADYGAGYYAAFLIDPDGYRIEAYFAEKA